MFLLQVTNNGFDVLLWGTCIIVPALIGALGVLWRAKVAADKEHKKELIDVMTEHKKELKSEKDDLKSEFKEMVSILNSLSQVLSDLGRGVDVVPDHIVQAKELITLKADEIKTHIDLKVK